MFYFLSVSSQKRSMKLNQTTENIFYLLTLLCWSRRLLIISLNKTANKHIFLFSFLCVFNITTFFLHPTHVNIFIHAFHPAKIWFDDEAFHSSLIIVSWMNWSETQRKIHEYEMKTFNDLFLLSLWPLNANHFISSKTFSYQRKRHKFVSRVRKSFESHAKVEFKNSLIKYSFFVYF